MTKTNPTRIIALCMALSVAPYAFSHQLGYDFRSATDLGSSSSWPEDCQLSNIRDCNAMTSRGEILSSDDASYFRFRLTNHAPLWIVTEGETDTYGTLYDSDGLRIDTDDDTGADDNFGMFSRQTTGTYYIRVDGRGNATGRYRLRIESGIDDHSDFRDAATSTWLSIPSEIDARLEDYASRLVLGRNIEDVDWFQFQVSAEGGDVQFSTRGSATSMDADLYDSHGDLVTSLSPRFRIGTTREINTAVRGLRRGIYYVAVHSYGSAGTGQYTFSISSTTPQTRRILPFVPQAGSSDGVQGFVRVDNHSNRNASVDIVAVDATGERFGPTTISLEPWQVLHFNSGDLEFGNDAKDFTGVGSGQGDWYLEVLSDNAAVQTLGYIRTSDGFVTSMNTLVPRDIRRHWVTFFNPGSNSNQVSSLRLINPCPDRDTCNPAEVTIAGVDDSGETSGSVNLTLDAGAARFVTARDLEQGAEGLEGALGDGAGKWRLLVTADKLIHVVSLLRTPTGHVTNLSPSDEPQEYTLP